MTPLPRRPAAIALPFLPAAALAVLLIALAPIGYLGGGGDDWQYLEAARCIVAKGWCLPQSHWAARLPMTVSTALAIGLFGESREALWTVPLLFGGFATIAFAMLTRRHFGDRAAGIATLALVATPSLGGQLVSLNVSLVEFAFAMLGLLLIDRASRGGGRGWATAGGVAIALAILTRATSVALVPILLAGLWLIGARRLIVPVIAGVAAGLLVEAIGYGIAIGNPFHGWQMALGHTQLQTSELAAGVDRTASPLFNPAFIAGWKRAMGIHLHWTVDGVLNLLANPAMGPTLLAALALLLIFRKDAGRTAWGLLLAGGCQIGALTYGLAVDPQPRLFLPAAAAGAVVIGMLGARCWQERGRRPIILLLLAILMANAIAVQRTAFDLRRIERAAAAWTAADPARWSIDETARRVLTLVPAIRDLPPAPAEGATRALMIGLNRCPPAFAGQRLFRDQGFPAAGQRDAYHLCAYQAAAPFTPVAPASSLPR